jgi:ubiquinone/menaquinone biosynthesis C-methylase UbiE
MAAIVYPQVSEILRWATDRDSLTLEVGCGPGQYRTRVNGRYIGLDVTRQNYSANLPRRVDVVADGQKLPFTSDTFGCVFFCAALYQVLCPEQALDEALRVLRPGGRLLVFDYNRRTHRRLAVEEGFSRRCWTQEELLRVVASRGYRRTAHGSLPEGIAEGGLKSYVRRWLSVVFPSLYLWLQERREGWAIVFAEK